jgi:hypothetical protein
MATARKRTATRRSVTRKSAARKTATRKPAARKAGKAARKTGARKASRAAGAAQARKATTARKAAPARKIARKAGRKAVRKAARKTARAPAPRPRNPVNWFEIPVRDMQRAQAFYERVLQITLTVQDMGTFRMAFFPGHPDAFGAAGTLMQSEDYTPSHLGSMVYFAVPDIDATLARVQANGGRVLNPRMSVGEYGFVAHFEDCEGNRVALHSMA